MSIITLNVSVLNVAISRYEWSRYEMSHSMLPARNSFKIWQCRNAEKVKITLPPNFSKVKVGKRTSDKADFNALIIRISNIT